MRERIGCREKFVIGTTAVFIALSGAVLSRISKERLNCTGLTVWGKNYALCMGKDFVVVFDGEKDPFRVDGNFDDQVVLGGKALVNLDRDGLHYVILGKNVSNIP